MSPSLTNRIRWVAPLLAIPMILGLQAIHAADAKKMSWDFESDEPGKIARGFSAEVGTWEVAADGTNRVLAQKATNPDDTFNVALVT